MICWIVTLNCSAIPLSVSPDCTTYFFPAAAGTVAVAAGAATVAVAIGTADALGAAVVASGEATRVAVRAIVTLARAVAATVGVSVLAAPGRVHAPSSNAAPAILAVNPQRTSQCFAPIVFILSLVPRSRIYRWLDPVTNLVKLYVHNELSVV